MEQPHLKWKRWRSMSMEELAMEYAMLDTPDFNYAKRPWYSKDLSDMYGDEKQNNMFDIKQHMQSRAGPEHTETFINQAHETLKVMGFHPEENN